MIDFTIMEYNFETKKYTEIGAAEAKNSEEAKKDFAKKTGWKENKTTMLFAKQPICRQDKDMTKRWYEDEDFYSDCGGNDEYYEAYCCGCNDKTEHDVCTDECVECGGQNEKR